MALKGKKQTLEWKQKMSRLMSTHTKAFKKGQIPWNKGIHIKGHKHTKETKEKISKSKLELYKDKTKHPSYQFGISYSKQYTFIHTWLRNNFGKANKCESVNCINKKAKKFDYAKLHNKEYLPLRVNFIQLCRSCHMKYDKK